MALLSHIVFPHFTSVPPSSLSVSKTHLRHNHHCLTMASSSLEDEKKGKRSKRVWIWTENKQVMTAALERGWNTFLFSSKHHSQLAHHWSSIAVICPLFVGEGEILDAQNKRVATVFDVSNPEELELLTPEDEKAENIVVNLLDWQEYFDRRAEESNLLNLTKATVTNIQVAGMGDRVCVDLCSLMKPGEGLLVGSFARGLFLVHSECLETNYIASRPFRVNAGPVHAYVAVPGGRTCYLSELKSGKEVIVVDQKGQQRIAVVGRVKIESRPLILVEAKSDSDDQIISILLQNAETVGLVCPQQGNTLLKSAVPVTSLKVGDEVLLRVQGGARHTGIEIQEFIVEK